jgi:carboxyl-terminal processing protease
MFTRQRQPLLAWLALMLPVLLVIGIWLGGHPADLPGFLRSALVADQDTRVVNQAIDEVSHDYYRPLKRADLANASIAGIVASLHDRFSNYLTPKEFRQFDQASSFSGVGIDVRPVRRGLLVDRVFDQSPAARAGVKAADVIVAVGGRSLRGLPSSQSTKLIMGPPGTDVKLTLVSGATSRTVTVMRAVISEPVVASRMRTVQGRTLGEVGLAMFSPGAHGDVRQAVGKELHAGARGLLLDLRHNGGGLVEEARLVASIFIPEGVIVTTRGRTQPTMTLSAAGDAIPTSIPLVVLVDGDTASASEIVTGALQDHHRAVVVGTHTFGKGVFQEVRPLSNGGALDITVGQYFTPNGRNLGGGGVSQGAGISPDVPVPAAAVDRPAGEQLALRALAARVR